jgi:hypothetical protein
MEGLDEQIKEFNENIMCFRVAIDFICQSNAGS